MSGYRSSEGCQLKLSLYDADHASHVTNADLMGSCMVEVAKALTGKITMPIEKDGEPVKKAEVTLAATSS